VPDPEEFNSTSFDKDAFIAGAKETNDKLSEQISSHMITPPLSNPSSASSTCDHQTPETKRQKLTKNRRNKSTLDTTPIVIRPSESKKENHPFSIDSIINTPPIPKPVTPQRLQTTPFNSWLFAMQLNQSIQALNWYQSQTYK
jgi:hypothetical protein